MTAGLAARACAVRALVAVCMTAAAGAEAQPHATPLRADETLRTEHGATDRFSYTLDLADGGPFLLRVEQRGLDLIVTVESPNGAAESYNSPLVRDGCECVVIARPGRYLVDVRSEEHTGARGGHTISLARLPTGVDARELEAWNEMAAGEAANFAAGEAAWTRSADAYDAAAQLWDALGRSRERADALFGAASVRYWQLYDWAGAAEDAAGAAEVYATLGEAALAASSRHLQGASLVEQALEASQSATDAGISPESAALFAEALRLFEQARAVHEQLGNVYDLGLVVNNFGYTYFSMGDLQRARGYFAEAAVLLGSVDEWTVEANALQNIAAIDAEAGELVSAGAAFERILELLPADKPAHRANVLDNLGATQRLLGDTEQALQTFSAALVLQREVHDAPGAGRSLRRIGETYYTLGELELAKQYLEQALPVALQTNDGRSREAALRNLGNVAYLEREYEAALDYHRRALEVAASLFDRAHLQLLVAKDLLALGRGAESAAAAAAAARVADDTGSAVLRAGALNAAGRAELLAGDAAAAIARLERSAEIFGDLGMRAERAEALHGLSLAARASDRFAAAVAYGEEALSEVARLRERVADPELRAFFAAARRDYYDAQIDLLMRAGAQPAERAALEISERGRARMTADLLQEASIDLRRGADPDFLARERTLYAQLAEQRKQRDLVLESSAGVGSADDALGRIVAELAALENSLNLLEIELRRSNPRLAEVTAPQALTPEQMQARLDDDTVLLQYALGPSASYVWAVTRDSVVATRLADRATIEAAARSALAGLQSYVPGTAEAASRELAELAALVLGPVASRLTKRRIVLALDGALQYVPFAALPVRTGEGNTERPLLDAHELVEIPSLSTLAVARRDEPPRASRTLAVFADPVFQAADPRLGGALPQTLVAATDDRVARAGSRTTLNRLLSTGYEAESIAALVPEDRRILARGFAANRDAVLDSALADFRYIHFATHGLVDARYPGLSALVLSQFDARGNPQDGYLRLSDIYNLKLGADLVVLSACDTALGREVRGEGLIGLTQGFLAAGARSLVASLWQVPDRATAELMTKFYGFMLNDGMRPAEALREAQLWSAAQPRFRHPYFWGGFVLVGDWR
jgi:CHAT domain-containing protein/tetratricopeptide (TPR) repeat protein